LTTIYTRFHTKVLKDSEFTRHSGSICEVLYDHTLSNVSAYWELPMHQCKGLYAELQSVLNTMKRSTKPIHMVLVCETVTKPDFTDRAYVNYLPDHIRLLAHTCKLMVTIDRDKFNMDVSTVIGTRSTRQMTKRNKNYISILLLDNTSARRKWNINHNVYFTLMCTCMKPYGAVPHILSKAKANEAIQCMRDASQRWNELQRDILLKSNRIKWHELHGNYTECLHLLPVLCTGTAISKNYTSAVMLGNRL